MPVQTLYDVGESLLEDPLFEMMRYGKKLYFVPKKDLPPPPPPHVFGGLGMPPLPPPSPMRLVHKKIVLEDEGLFSPYRVWILGGVINLLMLLFLAWCLKSCLDCAILKVPLDTWAMHKPFKPLALRARMN